MTKLTLEFGDYAFPVWVQDTLPEGLLGFVQRRGNVLEVVTVEASEDGAYIAPFKLAVPEPVAVLAEA